MSNEKFFITAAEKIIPLVNDSPYKRILAIGDMHAAFDKLLTLWEKISVTTGDLVIFLGDYLFGRLGNNFETLRWLVAHGGQPNIKFLHGNGDDEFLNIFFDKQGNLYDDFDRNFVNKIKDVAVDEPEFPRKIFDFMNGLENSFSVTVGGKKYFFCHAGIKVGVPLDKQTKTYLVDHPHIKDFYNDYSGDAVIVVGHKAPIKIFGKLPQLFVGGATDIEKMRPMKVPARNILMLDTRAKDTCGYLSCVDVLSGEFWQA